MIKNKIWICEECDRIFTEEEMLKHKEQAEWGHPCKAHPKSLKPYRCEAYLHKYEAS